ncbi:helix-turn-helix transcriptional regulator [Oceanicoccus sp.]
MTLNKIENNNGNVKLDTLNTICKYLKCEMGDLFI